MDTGPFVKCETWYCGIATHQELLISQVQDFTRLSSYEFGTVAVVFTQPGISTSQTFQFKKLKSSDLVDCKYV